MNNNEISQVIDILENVHTEEDILKYSSLIYSSPVLDKKAVLENIIRFGDLDAEHIKTERNKLDKLMTNITESDTVASQYMNKMSNLINNKIGILESGRIDKHINLINIYDSYLNNDVSDTYYAATEAIEVGSNQSVSYSLESLELNDKITGKGIITACENVFTNPVLTDTMINQFTNVLKNRIENTIRYEMTCEEYHDIPMLSVLESCKVYLKEEFSDNESISDEIEKMFDDIQDDVEDEIKDFKKKILAYLQSELPEGFFDEKEDDEDETDIDIVEPELVGESTDNENDTPLDSNEHKDPLTVEEELSMNPFNSIYQMTPFPVGARTVARTVNDCLNAETDEELIESLNEFGKLMTVCEMLGEDILTEKSDTAIAKAKRNIKHGTDKLVQGTKTIAHKIHDSGVAGKKIIDPMVRFIEKTYDDATMKDLDDRKKAVMAQGLKGKALRIGKWWRDVAIGAVVTGTMAAGGFTIGTVISAISLLGYIARNKMLDDRARNAVIKELEDELAITREKIEDSRGDDNKQNKYQLMRIESKLDKELTRIKTHRQY